MIDETVFCLNVLSHDNNQILLNSPIDMIDEFQYLSVAVAFIIETSLFSVALSNLIFCDTLLDKTFKTDYNIQYEFSNPHFNLFVMYTKSIRIIVIVMIL